jgi:hypothetical protein
MTKEQKETLLANMGFIDMYVKRIKNGSEDPFLTGRIVTLARESADIIENLDSVRAVDEDKLDEMILELQEEE